MLSKYCLLPLLFLMLLLPMPLLAKGSDFTLKIESTGSNNTSITHDIEKAFNQLQQTLSNNEHAPLQTYAQIIGTIEQYEYLEEDNKQWLIIKFNEKSTRSYLKQNKLLPMPDMNPTVIVYVAQKVDDNETLLDIESNPAILTTITQQASKAGLTLITPAMDLNDMETLSFKDVWQQNMPALKQSASRYQATGILLVTLQKTEGANWQSSWHLYQNDLVIETSVQDASLAELAQQAMTYFQLHKKTATRPNKNIRIQATLSNAKNDYQTALLAIKKTPGVLAAQLDGVTQGSVFYTLSVSTDENDLISKLKGHNKIINVRVMP